MKFYLQNTQNVFINWLFCFNILIKHTNWVVNGSNTFIRSYY